MYENLPNLSIHFPPIPEIETIEKVHFIGICGTGMSAAAKLLLDLGKQVQGSDLRKDPPTGPLLEKWGAKILLGYSPENLSADLDLIVIGNAVTKDNPEVVAALVSGIPIVHMPRLLDLIVAPSRPRIVVAGTHGKSTTSAITAWLLKEANRSPGWFIGASPLFGDAGMLGSGPFVFEGDEYNACFFDRKAKFFHYCPNILLVTNVEFDHADLYDSYESILQAFQELIRSMPLNSHVILSPDAEFLLAACRPDQLVTMLREEKFRALGSSPQGVDFTYKKQNFSFPLPGRHEAIDAALALAACESVGIPLSEMQSSLSNYPGLQLRQTVLLEQPFRLIRDFGHHPTELKTTIEGIQSAYFDHEIWVVFEPRSYTSRTNQFQKDYVGALTGPDQVYLCPVFRAESLKENALNVIELAEKIGKKAQAFSSVLDLAETICQDLNSHLENQAKIVVVCFSNGTMENLPQTIVERFS